MTILDTLKEVNQRVVAGRDYSNYYIAKYDKNFSLIGFYKNRNQAVIHHFQQKGLSKKAIMFQYLKYNAGLRAHMERGYKWFGHYYMYMEKAGQPLLFENINPLKWGDGQAQMIPVIVVDAKGKEYECASHKNAADQLQIEYSNISRYKDTGKFIPNKKVAIYTKNKKKSFTYFKDAVVYYHMNKNRLRAALKTGNKIRGQKVTIK